MGLSRRTFLLSGLGIAALGTVGGAYQVMSPKNDSAPSVSIVTDNALEPLFPDMTNIWAFGSSTLQLLSPHLAGRFAGAVFHGEGKGGERAQHIFARQGSTPARLNVSGGRIPANGAVTVTAWNMPASAFLKPYAGTLSGVSGVLSSTTTSITFTRTGAGAPVDVRADTPFIPSTLEAVRNSVALINGGKNNLKGTVDEIGRVTTLTDAAYDWLAPLNKRCVPMTHFVDSNESPGSVQFNNVQGVNKRILARYGSITFDVNEYLLSSAVWADTRISPTHVDLQQQAEGLKPDSLSRDAAHLNSFANAAVAARIHDHFVSLGYYPATQPSTLTRPRTEPQLQ